MPALETWMLMSYVVTVIGLPLAIFVFLYEQHKERTNEEYEVYQLLSDNYQDFLKVVLANPDLRLNSRPKTENLNEEQHERMTVIFGMLVSLFERAYLLLYDPPMSGDRLRRWRSWEDYMTEWCQREDFKEMLPELLRGEDPDFADCIQTLAARADGEPAVAPPVSSR
jgi:hypothetical protein